MANDGGLTDDIDVANQGKPVIDELQNLLAYAQWPDSISFWNGDLSDLAPKRKVRYQEGYCAGEFFSLKNRRFVEHETGLEQKFYEKLEKSECVKGYVVQPMKIPGYDGSDPYIPDVLIQLSNNRIVVVELKPASFMRSYRNVSRFAGLQAFCKAAGFGWLLTDGEFASAELAGRQVNSNFRKEMVANLDFGSLNIDDVRFLREKYSATRLDVKALIYQLDLLEGLKPYYLCYRKENLKPFVPLMWRSNRPV